MRKLHAAVSLLLILASLSGCSEKDAVTTEEPDTGSAIVTEEETQTETTEEEMKIIGEITWKNARETVIAPGTWAPRICRYGGVLLAGVESPGGILVYKSENGGKAWKDPVVASFYPELNCANVNFYADKETLYLAYRATSYNDGKQYTSLRVSVSDDGGGTWREHSTVCEYTDGNGRGGVWEPFLFRINGELACVYANDHPSVTDRQNIEYVIWDGKRWKGRKVISKGTLHDSRDGMPVMCRTPDGTYVCVIESTADRDRGNPFVLKAFYSDDGVKWSEPVTVYTPKTRGSKAAAPGIVYLPDGRYVITFQTDEDATVKGDPTSVMKCIVSNGDDIHEITAGSFSPAENIFGTPDGEGSVWTGVFFDGEYLYASAGTSRGSSLKFIKVTG